MPYDQIGVECLTIMSDGWLQTEVERLQPVPNTGVALAVISRGNVVLKSTLGYSDREYRLPVTESTLFQIGSATKAFGG